MQNSYHKLIKEHWSIVIIIVLVPLLLWAVIPILPTHDDWAGTTKPDFTPFFTKEHFFFYGYHWRPFDTWIGYIVGKNPQVLWPTFNHVLVVVGHLLCTLSIYQLLKVLNCTKTAKNIATLYFFITPAAMATVTAVDSQNQVYALTCGIISFLFYIKMKKGKYPIWISLVFLATLFKENGLMWAWICPILAYGYGFIDKQTLKKDLLIGLAIMVSYALAIVILPKNIIIHQDYVPDDFKVVKNIVKFLFTTFITIDYIYLLHQPSRQLTAAGISFLLAVPFIYYIFIRNIKCFKNKKIICTFLCLLIAVAPHLGTVFSMMHTYAGLAILTVIIAYSISHIENIKPIIVAFVLWIVTAVVIDIHLIDSSIKSGIIGKEMAREAIRKTGMPVKSVYVIIIEDDYPKLSSFCVIPYEAFGWGLAAQYETNYQWPKIIEDTTLCRTENVKIEARKLGRKRLNSQHTDCVWIVDHQSINVIKK